MIVPMPPKRSTTPARLPPSSGRLVRGLRVAEVYAICAAWQSASSSAENMQRVRATDVMGNTSGYSTSAFATAISQRFDLSGRDRDLTLLAKAGIGFDIFRPILLWRTCLSETILHRFFTDWLYARYRGGSQSVSSEEVLPFVQQLHARKLIPKRWSLSSEQRISSALLTMAAEAGLIEAGRSRRFKSFQMPDEAFIYLLHAMHERQPNAHDLVHSTDWHMFLMDAAEVERQLFRLHQFRRLHYEAAGTIAQLSLPCASATDYVREITR